MENNYESIEYVKKQPVWAFYLLSFCSFGLYTIYWFYKNWSFFKRLYDWDIYPVWRAIFAIFFTHALLEQINDFAVEKGHPGIRSDGYATGFVIVSIVQQILGRALPPNLVLFWLFLSPFLFLIPSVKQLNYIYEQAHPNEYRPTFSPGEFVVLVLGSIMIILIIVGSLMGVQ